MKKLPDGSLMDLVKGENHLAFTVLVDRYWQELYRHVWYKIRNSDDAKDIIQEIFLGLWKNRSTIVCSAEEKISPYLFRAAKYSVINYFSRPGILIADEKELSGLLEFPSHISSDDSYLLKELKELLDIEVSNLPERLQIPYRLSREQDLTIKEIAAKLCISEQTVKNNISTALHKIRYRLGQYNADTTIGLIVIIAAFLHEY